MLAEQLPMIIFMTAPQMMQQAIEEELGRKAALRSVSQPVKFGNWVVQVIESCINEENPLQSIPLYVTVPVENIGDQIDPNISKLYALFFGIPKECKKKFNSLLVINLLLLL